MSHKKATTDNGKELHLYSRIGMYNEKVLSFFNADGSDYDFTDVGVEIGVKKNRGDDDFITLTDGGGITITDNDVHFVFTEAQSATFKERPYYWQFRRTIDSKEKVWLNGDHDWHNGKFDAFSDSGDTIQINENGEVINIVIQESGGTSLFLGYFVSLAALQLAYPTAEEGNYAYVDEGVGTDVITYIWDETDQAWVEGGGGDFVESVVAGDNISVDNTDPQNPIVNWDGADVDGITIEGDGSSGDPLHVPEDTFDVFGAAAAAELAAQGYTNDAIVLVYRDLKVSCAASSVTGTTSETLISSESLLIPGGIIQSNDILEISLIITKSGANGNLVTRINVNDSNTLIGDTSICALTSGAANLWVSPYRRMTFLNPSSQIVFSSTSSGTDSIISNSAHTDLTLDFTTDKYITISLQQGSNLDTTTLRAVYIRLIRQQGLPT